MSPIGWPGCLYTHSFERSCVKLLSLNLPHKHTVKRARFWILILLLFARVCVCMCEREGVSVCVRDFPAVCAVRRSQCSSSLYPTQNSQPENCVSDVMSWLLKKPKMCFFFSLLYFQSQYQSNIAHSRLCCLHVHKKKNQMLTAPPICLSVVHSWE